MPERLPHWLLLLAFLAIVAGVVSQQFIEQALPCFASAPPGALVVINELPHRIDYGSPDSQVIDAFVFEPYSLESIVKLLVPATAARVDVRSSQDIRARPST